MTDEQVENYRKVLFHIVGPYALIMPREEVIRYKDEMQSYLQSFRNVNETEVEK